MRILFLLSLLFLIPLLLVVVIPLVVVVVVPLVVVVVGVVVVVIVVVAVILLLLVILLGRGHFLVLQFRNGHNLSLSLIVGLQSVCCLRNLAGQRRHLLSTCLQCCIIVIGILCRRHKLDAGRRVDGGD